MQELRVFLLQETDGSCAYITANNTNEAFSTYQAFFHEDKIEFNDCTIIEIPKEKWQSQQMLDLNSDVTVSLAAIMEGVTYSRVIAVHFPETE